MSFKRDSESGLPEYAVYNPAIHLPEKRRGKFILKPEEYRRRQKEVMRRWFAKPEVKEARRDRNWEYRRTAKARIERKEANWRAAGIKMTCHEYDSMAMFQDYKCALCRADETEMAKGLVVDHNHKTGEVRELLCTNCNSAIGLLKEELALFQKAVDYLTKHKEK